MALLSGFAGVYTEAIIKKRPSRNINVQNFWLYIFGMLFNLVAICVQDFGAVINKGFFHGYSFITILMILNHALSGIAVSMVMKYADNIVKVYSTSVAMLLTAIHTHRCILLQLQCFLQQSYLSSYSASIYPLHSSLDLRLFLSLCICTPLGNLSSRNSVLFIHRATDSWHHPCCILE